MNEGESVHKSKKTRERESVMKQSVATAISIAAMMGLTVSAQALAGTTTGSASVTIVEPLSVTEVSSFSFIHTNTINEIEHGDESSSLIVSNSPREKPITAISHSDPIKWGEFTISGKNYAQISVSSIKNSPRDIKFSKEKAVMGDVSFKMGSQKYESVDISTPKKLSLYSALEIEIANLSGRYQPTYTVALHYE